MEALTQRYRVLDVDLRGSGRFDFPHPRKPYTQVDDLRALFDHAGIQSAAVLDFSLGSWAGWNSR